MARRRAARAAAPAAETTAEPLLVPVAVLLALLLPFVLYSAASDEAVRESKLLLVGLGSALALLGLARQGERPRLARPWLVAAAVLGSLVVLSAAARAATWLDPLTAVALLAPVPLVLAGASRSGSAAAGRALELLSWCGAATGALATLQRFGGVLRMPIAASDPRFFATGLVGNPGDLAAALVVPALLLWDRAARGPGRAAAALGFTAVLSGIGSTEAIGPLVAVAAGIAAHVAFDPRRRLGAAVVAGALTLGATVPTGAAGRALSKWTQLRSGDVSRAFTQRDIGVGAALQMIRSSPLLGVGPGAYENAFVPARLAAEGRLKRRLVHQSDAAHFENAHSEPLDIAAECGIPALLLSAGLWFALVGTLVSRRRDGERAGEPPTDLLVAVLAAFFVLALGSFPLRMAPALAPAAFVAGVALRRAGAVEDAGEARPAWRVSLTACAAALGLLALVRFASVQLQARGEIELRSLPLAGEFREQLLADTRRHLALASRLRPRKASALLELGSATSLAGDATRAWELTRRSHRIEERAETDVALGLLARARGDEALARLLLVRAVWILPKSIEMIPDEAAPGAVEEAVRAAEHALGSGGAPPPLPSLEP